MSSPDAANGPFYFAWVNPDQNIFDEGTMLVEDEDIFDFVIKHEEGQFSTLELTVQNPRVGLLNAGRKLWGWFSYRKQNNSIKPLFFGVLTGVPTDMFAELVKLKFNARPHDFIPRKQAVAETLKIRPYYDPIWLDDTHRDDPDAILEGWSKLYHIDRVTHEITVSDILEGEDGTVVFDETQGIYESVKMDLGECPLDSVLITGNVQWTQRCSGVLPQPIEVNVSSYTGASFKGDWPKPGAGLGGGWKCEASYVKDILGTEHAKSVSNSSTLNNNDPSAGDCSIESASMSVTSCSTPGICIDSHVEFKTGLCDPLGFNPDGSQGVNWPASINSNGTMALLWTLNCNMHLRYDAKREFTEQVSILVQANVQPTVTSPSLDQHTETINISGANVGLPLLLIDAWSDWAGRHVPIGTTILPNDRRAPGGTSYQVCIVAGTAGLVEPVFSDIPGTVTTDGGVSWSSVGNQPPTTQPAWTDSTPIPAGEIVLYEPKVWSDASGSFNTTGESCFLICLHGGTTNSEWEDFTYVPSAADNTTNLPLPVNNAYIRGPGQLTPYVAPIPSGLVGDGTVTWLSLGTAPHFLGIPIGGTTENVTARSFFTKDRGYWSIEYLICKARARLRLRSRCVRVSWDAPFEDCLDLSLRKNATLSGDKRIPGQTVSGKITSYELIGSRDGKLVGNITIGVPVGYGGSVSGSAGTAVYTAATGYMQAGYQAMAGAAYAIAGSNISYTAPLFRPFDDGLSFPLQFFPGVLRMTTPDQVAAVEAALAKAPKTFISASQMPKTTDEQNSTHLFMNPLDGTQEATGQFLLDINPREYALEAAPIACEIIIHPVINGPFNGSIVVECSTLEIPQGIDLSAEASL